MKKIIATLALIIGMTACSSKSETIMKNGVLLESGSSRFSSIKLGEVHSSENTDQEVFLLTIDSVQYIFTMCDDGAGMTSTMIKK